MSVTVRPARTSVPRRPGTGIRACTLLLLVTTALAQHAPSASDHPWTPTAKSLTDPAPRDVHRPALDPAHVYTLAELIDLAEQHNPDTRASWQAARIRAAQLGIARSELYPALAIVATGATTRSGILFNTAFVRQTIYAIEPAIALGYTLYDFGARSAKIDAARQQLLAANFAFNTLHLDILFETSRRYFRLLNQDGQRDAAEINLKNAQAVQSAVDAKLVNGLSTLPDALEARAAAAQADFELQAALGQVEIARGDLLTILGASPAAALLVQPLTELAVPDHIDGNAQEAIERSLQQRPELAQRVAQRRAAEATIRGARSAYFPTLKMEGDWGKVRAYGQQNLLPGTYVGFTPTWSADINLHWTIFDGTRREAELSEAHSEQRRAQAELDANRDEVEEQVWVAWANLQTAFRQRQAAAALLNAAQSSYQASLKSYTLGLRNTVDVVTSQRTLALALSQDIAARTDVLTQITNIAFRTGDLLRSQRPTENQPPTEPPTPGKTP